MCDLIIEQPAMLQMMSRFGIPLGVEDHTVAEVCAARGVDPATFLAVANLIKFGPEAGRSAQHVSLPTLLTYLRQAHDYFLEFQLPMIRRKLLEAIVTTDSREISKVVYLIVKFFDDFTDEVRRHMSHEDTKVFSYVDDLLKGMRRDDFSIAEFARSHDAINSKLQELKNIIIKYYKPDRASDSLNSVVYDLFVTEYDLRRHCEVENALFVPAVEKLEASAIPATPAEEGGEPDGGDLLSDREKEVVKLVVEGLRNKEIAEKLFISPHTVLTHRKNISHKLNIHSVSGLTIYAIVNNIVNLDELE